MQKKWLLTSIILFATPSMLLAETTGNSVAPAVANAPSAVSAKTVTTVKGKTAAAVSKKAVSAATAKSTHVVTASTDKAATAATATTAATDAASTSAPATTAATDTAPSAPADSASATETEPSAAAATESAPAPKKAPSADAPEASDHYADKPQTDEAAVAAPVQNVVVDTPKDRARSSFYLGLGASMLNDRGFTGLMPKIYGGYGGLIGTSQKVYGAIELSGGAGSLQLSSNQNWRVSHLMAASVIPGYMWNETTMLFARLGAQSTHYSKQSSTRGGSLVGIGVEMFATKHWDSRIEYDYANNKNLNQFNIDCIYKFR